MDFLLLMVVVLFVVGQILIFLGLCFNKQVKLKKQKLSKFYAEKSQELGLKSKPLSFFTLGILLYNPLTKKMKINSYLLWKRPLNELYYLLGRQMRLQASYQGQGKVEILRHLNKERALNFWFVGLLLVAAFAGIVIQSNYKFATEEFESIQSLLNFPANLVLIYGLYRRFFSRAYRQERISLHKDLDSFSDEHVGGGSSHWEKKLSKRRSKVEPCYKERHTASLKFPLKDNLKD